MILEEETSLTKELLPEDPLRLIARQGKQQKVREQWHIGNKLRNNPICDYNQIIIETVQQFYCKKLRNLGAPFLRLSYEQKPVQDSQRKSNRNYIMTLRYFQINSKLQPIIKLNEVRDCYGFKRCS